MNKRYFIIEDRAGVKVVQYLPPTRGCRPASDVEVQLWDEVTALRADKERLDWMEDNIHALHYGLDCKVCIRGEDGAEFNAETWRAAIDAARIALKEENHE